MRRKIVFAFSLISLIVLLSLVFFLLYNRYSLSQANNLFVQYESTEEVDNYLNSLFLPNQTTKAHIQAQIDDGSLGSIYCIPTVVPNNSTDAIMCEVLRSEKIFPEVFVITFYFVSDILSEITVSTTPIEYQ